MSDQISSDETPESGSTGAASPAPGQVTIEDGIAWVHLNDPEKSVNTLSTRYFEWFEQQIAELAGESLRALVFISDKPGYFIVGADIEELGAFTDPREVRDLIARGHQLVGRFAELPFPVIAAIDGVCLGGGLELALACDVRIATDASHTKLGLPEVQLGLFPGLGGTQRLPRLIGVPDALDLILTGKQINAKKAYSASASSTRSAILLASEARQPCGAVGEQRQARPASRLPRSKKRKELRRAFRQPGR